MNWHTLTVRQAQDVERIRRAAKDEDGLDSETKLLAAITGRKQSEIDSLPWAEYVQLRKQLDFMENPIEGNPAKFIKVNGKRYRCIYDISKMPFARYIEGKQFNQDFIMNLHKIAASMVIPQRKTFLGWRDKDYNALDHAEYAKDMLDAPFLTVYNSCVFFYHVYRNWMEVSKGYLISEAAKKMSLEEAAKSVNALIITMDGNIPPRLLPTTTISRLRRLTNYLLLKR